MNTYFYFLQSLTKSLDFIIDTASGNHPLDIYVSLLKPNGILVIVGAIGEIRLQSLDLIHGVDLLLPTLPNSLFTAFHCFNITCIMMIMAGSKAIAASVVGGTKDIKEMLEFCAANKIYPQIETIPMDYINEALDRLVNRDVKYRFVIDIENSLK